MKTIIVEHAHPDVPEEKKMMSGTRIRVDDGSTIKEYIGTISAQNEKDTLLNMNMTLIDTITIS